MFAKVRSHFRLAGPIYEQSLVFATSLLVFMFAITAVFYGFIGYYSRVSLISEFQKQNKDSNIDYIFMQIDQVERDEAELTQRRLNIVDLENKIHFQRATRKTAAVTSKEYEEYVTSAMAIIDQLASTKEILDDKYWKEVNRLDYGQPDLLQAELFSNPVYKPEVEIDKQAEFYRQIGSAIQNFRYKIVYYTTKHGSLITQIGSLERAEIDNWRAVVRQILTRNPQLASRDEIAAYGLQDLVISPSKEQLIAEYRAVVRSYRRALGSASIILQWPTIVSTMVVTLATGLLGGVVSFMDSAVRPRRTDVESRTDVRLQIIALIRRSVFGVMAALGIFLFAGSGLLVLTAQSSKLVSLGSIELSPYFVAFLAFVSGFLADDAFARITRAGRSILQTADVAKRVPFKGGQRRKSRLPNKI